MKSPLKLLIPLLVLFAAAVAPLPAQAQANFPRMTTVTPNTGKVGDVLVVEGQNLDQKFVKALYLTDGKHDYKTVILEQTSTSIKFKIAEGTKPGRLSLMILTGGKQPEYVEEPVKVTVQ